MFKLKPNFRIKEKWKNVSSLSRRKLRRGLQGRGRFNIQRELHHEFEFKAVYTMEIVERWIDYNYFGTIWYWMNYDVQ
jgi:hypothetical protein